MTNYVSLHNHTVFSLLDALLTPKDLFDRAKALGQKAVAITDHGSLAVAWDAYKAAKEVGIKYIPGVELYFVDDISNKEGKIRHIILLAKNAIGYKNILLLNRKGFDTGFSFGKKIYPVIDWKLLEEHSDGLICLTSCGNGIIGQLLNNKKFQEAEDTAKRLSSIFGDDFAMEVQPHALKRVSTNYNDSIDQQFTNFHSIRLAKRLGIRVVATTNAHYLNKEDHQAHDVLLAIGARQSIYSNARLKYDVPEFYVKSGDEVKAFFARNFGEEYAEEICQNSVYLADKCEESDWVNPQFSNPSGKELPTFPVQDEPDYNEYLDWLKGQDQKIQEMEHDKSFLRFRCDKGLIGLVPSGKEKIYADRLEEEYGVIEHHGFSSYMLIVADYINWAKKNNIRTGPGRGSVGGSLIAFVLGIHQANPLKYNTIFARFHNMEKRSFPDIDSDFPSYGKDLVQAYIRNKYGNDQVAHVSNINTITPKVYARDVARACELGGDRETAVKVGNDVAASLSAEIKTIKKAFTEAPLFVEYTKRHPELKKFAIIAGQLRSWGTHAGGIIISKRPLAGLIPLRKDTDGAVVIEYEKERAEYNGLVKMDILGLSTLDVIDETLRLIKLAGKPVPAIPANYDIYDKPTYDLISKGDTYGVFQLGTSSGTIDLCRKIKPKNLEEISAINSLARPAAKDIRKDYIATKNGEKDVNLLHPALERAFGATYGFGLYEECLLYLAQDIAGWNLHEADRLRKLTKMKGKEPEKAAAWRLEFIACAQKNKNIPEDIATKIWDEVVEKFGGYGFNISHSIFYAMTAYDTAYLKANYPIEFLLAKLKEQTQSNAPKADVEIEKIKQELRQHKVKIIPPDINRSEMEFNLESDGVLVTGLRSLKNVGIEAVDDILKKRPFNNFQDFMVRVDPKYSRSNAVQALAATGALDSFGIPRKTLFLYVSDYKKRLQVWLKRHDPKVENFEYPWPKEEDWTVSEKFALEQQYLGEAFICTKDKAYGKFFTRSHVRISALKNLADKTKIPIIIGEVKDVFEFKVKKADSKFFGCTMAKIAIEDEFGDRCSLTLFPESYKRLQRQMKELNSKVKLEVGTCLAFSCSVNIYEDEAGLLFDELLGCVPTPPLPADLKAKKVTIVRTKKGPVKASEVEINKDGGLLKFLEDELEDEGLLDLPDDNEENDD